MGCGNKNEYGFVTHNQIRYNYTNTVYGIIKLYLLNKIILIINRIYIIYIIIILLYI